MTKQEIVRQLTAHLRQQVNTMRDAAKLAHEASIGDEAKAEGKYDTRGLEASYLAQAQAEQYRKFADSLRIFESLTLAELPAGSVVEAGALVETELDGVLSYFLLTPCAGGMTIDYHGCDLTSLSPDSPLYQSLLGTQAGDILEPSGMMVLDVN
ncbi:MAG: hypothetical protein H7A51_08555 [Akkermansiaceae bacterium]|nr:hypothetical protein [Akkermansiaceae bacterium]